VGIISEDDVRTDEPRRGLFHQAALVTNGIGGRASRTPSGGNARRRGSVLATVVIAVLVAVLVGAIGVLPSRGTAAQGSTPANAEHPLVGAWIVDPEVDDPTNPPSFDAFMADGTVVNIGSDGASIGAWEATGPRTAMMTFPGLVQDSEGEAAFILRGNLEVDETGESLTGSHSFTLIAADGTVLAAAQGGAASGTRLHAEPLEEGGKTLPGFPAWEPAALEAGTPTS